MADIATTAAKPALDATTFREYDGFSPTGSVIAARIDESSGAAGFVDTTSSSRVLVFVPGPHFAEHSE
jgi:hypothetical protein